MRRWCSTTVLLCESRSTVDVSREGGGWLARVTRGIVERLAPVSTRLGLSYPTLVSVCRSAASWLTSRRPCRTARVTVTATAATTDCATTATTTCADATCSAEVVRGCRRRMVVWWWCACRTRRRCCCAYASRDCASSSQCECERATERERLRVRRDRSVLLGADDV